MSNRILPAIVAVAALAISSVASAHLVQMNTFQGLWFNEQGSPVDFSNSGLGNNPFVRWGSDLTFGQSGYNLDLAPPPPEFTLDQNVPPNTSPFFIGDFTHVNQPVGAPTITSIDLDISFDIVIDTTNDVGVHHFFFRFTHDETTNNLNPCPYDPLNLTGVNDNGCADSVTVSFLNASDSFTVGGLIYTFNLLGFSTDGGTTISDQFLTMEIANNTAGLYASIQTRDSVVPEPGTLALLGLGLIGVRLARRRVH